MKFFKKFGLSLVFQLSIFTLYSQNTIYVSAKGNDDHQGTMNDPLATIQAALDKTVLLRKERQLNDTVFIKVITGDYFIDKPLLINQTHSGTKISPLVIQGEGMDRSVVYGGIKLNQFEKADDGLWKVFVKQTLKGFAFEQLYINGERRFRAQTPDRNDFLSIKNVTEQILDSTELNRTFSLASLRLDFDGQNSGWIKDVKPGEENDIIASVYHKWDVTRLRLQRINHEKSSAYFLQYIVKPWNRIDTRSRLVIENYKAALDSPGEWFLDKSGYLYYKPMPGETIESVAAMAPVTEKMIVIAGDAVTREPVENIQFENIAFRVSGYKTPLKGNEAAQAAFTTDAAVMLDFAKNITFKNCEIANTGLYGIWFRRACSQSRLQNCHLHDLGAGGVKIGDYELSSNLKDSTHHIVVDNNIIQHGGYVFPAAVGVIIFHSMDNQVTHNDIADFKYTGVSVGWVWGYENSYAKRNKIEYNHIHHLGWGQLSDMGGVYTLGRSEGTTVSNNKIHHVYSRYYGGWGLYTDEGSSDIRLENNLVYACKSGGFHQHYGKDNLIKNNIFSGQLRDQLQATRKEPHNSFTFTNNIIYFDKGQLAGINWTNVSFITDKNCYWDTRTKDIKFGNIPFKEWQKAGKDVHSQVADPGFVNASAYDFRFKNKSVINKINFKPFDYNQYGVYGPEEWIKKSRLSAETVLAFDNLVAESEKKGVSDW